MPPYHETFRPPDRVKIAESTLHESNTAVLLVPEHHQYCGATTSVSSVEYAHNGDVFYHLEGVPGLWPEEWLFDELLQIPEWWGFPRTCLYYSIDTMDGDACVKVTDRKGRECLLVRTIDKHRVAEAMRIVAVRRHIVGFESRYGFFGTYNWREETGFVDYCHVRDFAILAMRSTTTELLISIREANGETERVLRFDGVVEVKQHAPLGMHVYAIAKCAAGNSYRFRFINSNVDDVSGLEIKSQRVREDST